MATNEETNAAGTDTRPPMLVEDDYDSWKIRIQRYIRGKPNGKLIWKSIQNGPTPHPMITDPPPTGSTIVPAPRKKLDSEFNEEENKLEMADTQAEIILSQGLPRHIFNILNQTSTAQEIWNNVELLMQGSGRTLQQKNAHCLMNRDISTTPYVQILTQSQSYEPHAKKTPCNRRVYSIVDPTGLYCESLKWFPKAVSPTIQPARDFLQLRTQCSRQEGETVTTAEEDGNVARQCKRTHRERWDSQYFKEKILLMELKRIGDVWMLKLKHHLEMPLGRTFRLDAETVIDDNTILVSSVSLDNEAINVPQLWYLLTHLIRRTYLEIGVWLYANEIVGVKPTFGASKTVPKRAPRNHSSLPVKSANARRVRKPP
ncbi:hypothetical protein Tco_1181855 [Tanacetum coccineum]